MIEKELIGLDKLEGRTQEYMDIVKFTPGKTLLSEPYLFRMFQSAKQVTELPGDVAEVGVYKGGGTMFLAKTFEHTDKVIHAFDTFMGMPPVDADKDWHKEGDFSDTSLEKVGEYLSDCSNVRLYKGLFPETAEPIKDTKFCMVYIDCDIYTSIMASCVFFYPRMSKGGVMIFDDYGLACCPGAALAVDEFFADKPDYRDGGLVIKL